MDSSLKVSFVGEVSLFKSLESLIYVCFAVGDSLNSLIFVLYVCLEIIFVLNGKDLLAEITLLLAYKSSIVPCGLKLVLNDRLEYIWSDYKPKLELGR